MFALNRVSGVLVALATPLNRDGSVDEPSITRLVEHVLAGGVHGLLPLGSTGEGAALDEAARRRVLSAVVEAGAGRVPVICGAANDAPDWVVRVSDDYARGDLAAARAGQDKVYQLVMALRGDVFPSAIKAALHMLGICEPWPAPPATRLDERRESRLRDRLAELGLHAAERSRH